MPKVKLVASPLVALAIYCVMIVAASVLGGMIPTWIRLTHRGMQIAVSFVAAMMFGVGMLHMLPHAIEEARQAAAPADEVEHVVMMWVMMGWLVMFFIERFFCFHHHDVESDASGGVHELEEACEHHGHDHRHDVQWGGAALGLTLHSILEGVALAASALHRHDEGRLAGLGAFLVIVLHKPFDSMTIDMLMTRGSRSRRWRNIVNGLFALAVPLGAACLYAGLATSESTGSIAAYALAFSAGTFLCISLSDLLPELQFHAHDRVTLSAALLLGLALAFGVGKLEGLVDQRPTAQVMGER